MRTNSHLAVGSPTARLAALLAATMLLAVALAAVGVAGQQLLAANGPIVVAQDGSGTYTTISEAVTAADDGDEILIRPGTYAEAVLIDKDITLSGDGPVADIVITAPDGGPTAYVGPGGYEPYAVLLKNSSGGLSGLTFSGEPSVVIINLGSPTVEGNVFEDVGYSFGERGMSFGGSSVVAVGGGSARIVGNTLVDGGPIAAFGGATPIIEGNALQDGPHIFLSGTGDGAQVIDNTIEDALLNGIGVYGAIDTTISGNTVARIGENGLSLDLVTGVVAGNSVDETPNGIWVEGGDIEVTGNTVSGSEAGLQWHARRGTLEGNMITDSGWGIVIASGAPVVSGNTSCANATNFVVGAPEELEGDPATSPAEPVIAEGDNEFCEDAAS